MLVGVLGPVEVYELKKLFIEVLKPVEYGSYVLPAVYVLVAAFETYVLVGVYGSYVLVEVYGSYVLVEVDVYGSYVLV